MKFEEVLPALREGKKIRKTCWTNGGYFLSKGTALSLDEMLADYWEIVEEDHKPCPGCGMKGRLFSQKDEMKVNKDEHMIECSAPTPCFATTPWVDTPEEAWAAWDKRV
jgi:hypothetical protein